MTQSNSHQLLRSTNTKSTTTIIFMVCSTLLIELGAAAILGGPNHILFTTTVNAQLVDAEETREDLRAAIVEEKLQKVVNQNQSNQPDTGSSSNGLTLRLDRAHFIPLSPLSDSPGNQVKMMLGYLVQNSSTLLNDSVNAIMEVYASNQTLLRTSSLPNPIVLDDWKGSIQLATTFDDPSLTNDIARIVDLAPSMAGGDSMKSPPFLSSQYRDVSEIPV